MWPHNDWLSADNIVDFLDEIVLTKGRLAFEHNGHTHLYSGPAQHILRNIIGPYAADPTVLIKNHARAIRRASQLNAVLIDHTFVGKYLENFKGIGSALIKGKGTFDYFDEHPEITDVSEIRKSQILPWQHASRYFALAAWGYVSTTVCGAPEHGVYYFVEAPYGLNEDHPTPAGMAPLKDTIKALFIPRPQPIEFINMFPFDRIEKLYTTTDWKKAHKAICLGEIRMARHDALQGVNPKTIRDGLKLAAQEVLSRPVETFQYFLESQEAYRVDKDYMFKHTTARPRKTSPTASPTVRQAERQDNLREFAFMALECVQAEIALLPPAQRPAIPAFSLIDGGMTLRA